MRALAWVMALALSGCGYYLAGTQPGGQNDAWQGQLALVAEDPFASTTRTVASRLDARAWSGTGFELVIESFTLSRRELAELSDRTEYELQAELTWGVRRPEGKFVLGPDTLRRDALLVLLDTNSDSLDAELESRRAQALYDDLTRQMLDLISQTNPADYAEEQP